MIRTQPFTEKGRDDFLALYRDCLRHYGIAPATPEEEERILSLLASGRHMSCLMAYDGTQPAGFATWALTFPAGAGIALYMKEIFVAEAARGRGVGRALLAGLVSIAEQEGCTRFDWQTDGDNLAAQTFYAAIGAPGKDKRSFRVMAADFSAFRARLG
ncbi:MULTISPECIES: GNAT family N-acetyltransferase [unclassified Roseovarius]|uniref:GNAT family N-acetyltransferase n=1 Tax=unclassified Roseovarius TaxID=2614913 RepID=UPI00273FF1BF|nr:MULTISPECIES: GNAT family N-acetyltransferase [unclassified Roseovarius]